MDVFLKENRKHVTNDKDFNAVIAEAHKQFINEGKWTLTGMNQTYCFHEEPNANKLKKLFKKQKKKRNNNRNKVITIIAICQNLLQISIFFSDRFFAGIRWTKY